METYVYSAILCIKSSVRVIIIFTSIMFLLGYTLVVVYRDTPAWLIENPWLHSKELPNRLPACINLAFVQSPFFALGILFKYYEDKILRYINVFGVGKCMIISMLSYIVLYIYFDHSYIGSSMCVAMNQYNNILFIFFIGMLGILALMCIGFRIQNWKLINYIGRYSILFYFLNGGVLTFVSPLMKKFSFLNPDNYYNQFFVAMIATAIMFPCVWFINKYLPILSGNKDSFNKLSKRFNLKIVW